MSCHSELSFVGMALGLYHNINSQSIEILKNKNLFFVCNNGNKYNLILNLGIFSFYFWTLDYLSHLFISMDVFHGKSARESLSFFSNSLPTLNYVWGGGCILNQPKWHHSCHSLLFTAADFPH